MPGSTDTNKNAKYAVSMKLRPKPAQIAQALAQVRGRLKSSRSKKPAHEPWSPENQ